MTLLTDVCWHIGDVDCGRVMYRQLLPYRELNACGFPEIVLGSVERPLGVLATMSGQWEDATEHFERALEMNARMGTRPWVAHTQHDYGRMAILRGDSGDEARAEELLRAAAGGYEELGMTAWHERAMADLSGIADSTPAS
jgi:hypothetical protein